MKLDRNFIPDDFAVVERVERADGQRACKKCLALFVPKRKSQAYCTTDCRLGVKVKVAEVACPKCEVTFKPRRHDQTHCSTKCSSNAKRGSTAGKPRAFNHNASIAQHKYLMTLNKVYYGVKPAYRDGFMRVLLDTARASGKNSSLSRVLTCPMFVKPPGHRVWCEKVTTDYKPGWFTSHYDYPGRETWLVRWTPAQNKRVYHRRNMAYLPVPKLAEAFCRKHLRCHVWQWVDGTAPDPETGEVLRWKDEKPK